jgi:hypothetical protein
LLTSATAFAGSSDLDRDLWLVELTIASLDGLRNSPAAAAPKAVKGQIFDPFDKKTYPS